MKISTNHVVTNEEKLTDSAHSTETDVQLIDQNTIPRISHLSSSSPQEVEPKDMLLMDAEILDTEDSQPQKIDDYICNVYEEVQEELAKDKIDSDSIYTKLKTCADLGKAYAQYGLARFMLQNNLDSKVAMKYLLKAAMQNYEIAILELAHHRIEGKYIQQNYELAAEKLQDLMNKEMSDSLAPQVEYLLGKLHHENKMIDADPIYGLELIFDSALRRNTEALAYLENPQRQSDAQVQYFLGLFYSDDEFLDWQKSEHHFKQAASQNHLKASLALESLYWNNQDNDNCFLYAVQSYKLGNEESLYRIGIIAAHRYQNGINIILNKKLSHSALSAYLNFLSRQTQTAETLDTIETVETILWDLGGYRSVAG